MRKGQGLHFRNVLVEQMEPYVGHADNPKAKPDDIEERIRRHAERVQADLAAMPHELGEDSPEAVRRQMLALLARSGGRYLSGQLRLALGQSWGRWPTLCKWAWFKRQGDELVLTAEGWEAVHEGSHQS